MKCIINILLNVVDVWDVVDLYICVMIIFEVNGECFIVLVDGEISMVDIVYLF